MNVANFDQPGARDAFKAGDAAAFEAAIAPLGVELTYATAHAFLAPIADPSPIYVFLAVIHQALVEPRGIGRSRVQAGHVAVAIREGDSIRIGVTVKSEQLPHGWPELKIWYAETDRSYNAIVRWAKANHPHLRIPIRKSEATSDTREADLIAAIIADPADDANRLVYADWLLEREDPRGQLIHAQCKLVAGPPQAYESPDRLACTALVGKCHAAFESDFDGCHGYAVVRGFVDHVACTSGRLAKLVKRGAFTRHPVRSLEIEVTTQGGLEKSAALIGALPPTLATHVKLTSTFYGSQGKAFDIGSDALAPLFTRAGSLAFRLIFTSEWERAYARMSRVTGIAIDDCSDEPFLAALRDPSIMPGLVDVTIPWIPTLHTAEAIGARAPLQHIEFSCPQGQERAIAEALLAHPRASLAMRHGDDLARALVHLPAARCLRAIRGALSAPAMTALAESPNTANIETVDADWSIFEREQDPAIIERLVAAIRGSKIRRIRLTHSKLSAAFAAALPEVAFVAPSTDGTHYLVSPTLP